MVHVAAAAGAGGAGVEEASPWRLQVPRAGWCRIYTACFNVCPLLVFSSEPRSLVHGIADETTFAQDDVENNGPWLGEGGGVYV